MRIIVACGGTGGHIFPALSFLETLSFKAKNLDILLVVTRRQIESKIIPQKYKVVCLDITSVKLKLNKKNLCAFFKLFKGILQSILIIFKFKPDVVVGFGGYAAFPLVFSAWFLRIKTIIHEQNVMFGFANRFLARLVDSIAISFKESKELLPSYQKKMVTTGNPLRSQLVKVEKTKALDFFNFSKNIFTILVMGGSLGAHKINQEFLQAVSLLGEDNKLQIIHLSGEDDFDFLKITYEKLPIQVRLFKFFQEMEYAYSAADLALCRAGATTLAELIFYQLPAIIVPYPFAYGHQFANAKILTQRSCAVLIQDQELSAESLKNKIIDFCNYPEIIEQMRSRFVSIKAFGKESEIADLVLTLN
jgi:UDP-N-acetylglucosamine--N-acetylmuramyl-(pentapeptide) pyrophosphoryl-undecaprenol N-acetylglucosamine transferase